MLEEILADDIKRVINVNSVNLFIPEDLRHGDYSTNCAMEKFEKKGQCKTANDLAVIYSEMLKKDNKISTYISKIDVAQPGFINFWLKKELLIKNLFEIIRQKENYGISSKNGQSVNFEFGQPNTHKLPHIGHLFSYIYGNAASNLLEADGFNVVRTNYQGDVGLHVAKCLWAYTQSKQKIPKLLEEKIKLLQKCYQAGSEAYDKEKNAKEEIDQLNQKIYAGDDSIKSVWQVTRDWCVSYYKSFEKRLDIKYNRGYFESEVYKEAKLIVEKNTPDVFEKSEGAIIFPGSKYGLHDRVFINSKGDPTYEAKDLALALLKTKESPTDFLIVATASEQNEYFKVMIEALCKLNDSYLGKFKHIGFGLIDLATGKMSSRTGEFIGAIELVEKVVNEIKKIIEPRKDLTKKEKEEISEKVGIGAIKYIFLKNNYLQNFNFDIKKSISKEGNSGPYLQYTLARAKSVIRKSKSVKAEPSLLKNYDLNQEELQLIRCFAQYHGVVVSAAKNYSPNLLCNYLYDLAQKYNGFYAKYRILDSNQEKTTEFRIILSKALIQIVANGLSLLGIETVNKM